MPLQDRLLDLLQPHLTPELLQPGYRKAWSPDNPLLGFCSIASEAAWFILGGPPSGWVSQVGRDDQGGTHWWLEHPQHGRLDLTASQYTLKVRPLPYELGQKGGKPCGFMGLRQDEGNAWGFDRKPSRRAALVLDALTAQWDGVEQVRAQLIQPFSRPRHR
jgi:hypothetical protein